MPALPNRIHTAMPIKTFRTTALLLAASLLTACSGLPTPPERYAAADQQARAQGWQETAIDTGSFRLAAWLPTQIAPDDELTVYIEGDGLSWLTLDAPSPDPTPLAPVALTMALAQPAGNAVYLARPCQYIGSPDCNRHYWTDRRFAEEVIAASNAAVDQLKARFGARRLVLVGYSGGGAVAALVAARRNDVERLVTVAGNLDHQAWTQMHRITPLTGSLNPADYRKALAPLPQWHFVGANDHNIRPSLVSAFAAGLPDAHVIVVPAYDHRCCWAEDWSQLWQKTLPATRPAPPTATP